MANSRPSIGAAVGAALDAVRALWRRPLVKALVALGALGGAGVAGAAAVLFLADPSLPGRAQGRLASLLAHPAPRPDRLTIDWRRTETGLMPIEWAEIPFGAVNGGVTGGGIDPWGDTLVFVSASGRIGFFDFAKGTLRYVEERAPNHFDEYHRDYFDAHVGLNQNWYRVNDILVAPDPGGDTATLYVAHQLFLPETEDMCMAVSRIGLVRRDGVADVSDEDWERVYLAKGCPHLPDSDYDLAMHLSGGKLLALDEDHLLLTVGSYGVGNFHKRWDLVQAGSDTHLGKIVEIDLGTGESSVYAGGFRNPEGLMWDEQGRLWESELAAQGGDEINIVRPGVDYGWPNVSLGTDYGRVPLPLNPVQGRHDGYAPPVFAFVPSSGPTQILPVPGDSATFPLWRGDLLVMMLTSQQILRFRIDGERVVLAEPIPFQRRLRDATWLPDGRIAVLTGTLSDSILLIRDPDAEGADREMSFTMAGYDAIAPIEAEARAYEQDFPWGRSLFSESCATCHSVTDVAAGAGPPLKGIVGARGGARDGFVYSPALASANDRWTRERLERFIADPASVYPGTAMPTPPGGLTRDGVSAIVDFLAEPAD